MSELKPCPICNNPKMRHRYIPPGHVDVSKLLIECVPQDNYCCGGFFNFYGAGSEKDMIKVYNTRIPNKEVTWKLIKNWNYFTMQDVSYLEDMPTLKEAFETYWQGEKGEGDDE